MMFNGATSFDRPSLYCKWQSNDSFKNGIAVCNNVVNCGWGLTTCPTSEPFPTTPAPTPAPTTAPCGSGNTTCPTTDSPRAFETKDELKAAVNSYCAGLNPDDSEYG